MLVFFTGLLTDGDDTFDDVVFGGLVQLGSTRGCLDVTKRAGIPTVAMCHWFGIQACLRCHIFCNGLR